MTTVDEMQPEETDAEEVLRATIDTEADGALRFEVAVWTRSYGPYLRYVFRVDRASAGFGHPFSGLDPDDRDGLCYGNIVADNQATRALLHLIASSDAELERVSGNNPPRSYRATLINCIRRLWD